MTTYSQEFLDKMKAKLLDRKQQLNDDLVSLHPHTELGGGSLEDEAMEIPVDEVNQDIIARMHDDIEKIDAALARLEDGSYGFDTQTGKPIGEGRLEVIPWADTAIQDEQ